MRLDLIHVVWHVLMKENLCGVHASSCSCTQSSGMQKTLEVMFWPWIRSSLCTNLDDIHKTHTSTFFGCNPGRAISPQDDVGWAFDHVLFLSYKTHISSQVRRRCLPPWLNFHNKDSQSNIYLFFFCFLYFICLMRNSLNTLIFLNSCLSITDDLPEHFLSSKRLLPEQNLLNER